MGILRFNQLYPPFDKPEARRALLSVVDQAEAMTAIAGADPANWLDGVGLFSHGTPLANDAGIDILRRPRDPSAAKKAAGRGRLRRRTYCRHSTDRTRRHPCAQPNWRRPAAPCRPQCRSAGDGIRRRRQAADQPVATRQGRLERFLHADRSLDPEHPPVGNPALRADGKSAYDGWPDSLRIEELRRAWLDAGDLAEQRRIAAELQMQVWQDLPFIPMGEYWQTTAYRRGLTGIIPGCFTVFYNVKRA
jgi:peptide/nickel transport system substrate-binding protein